VDAARYRSVDAYGREGIAEDTQLGDAPSRAATPARLR